MDIKIMSDSQAKELLRDLVGALDNAYISSWQTTAGWQKELDAASSWLNEQSDDDNGVKNERTRPHRG